MQSLLPDQKLPMLHIQVNDKRAVFVQHYALPSLLTNYLLQNCVNVTTV